LPGVAGLSRSLAVTTTSSRRMCSWLGAGMCLKNRVRSDFSYELNRSCSQLPTSPVFCFTAQKNSAHP
jgi:hypothetical protein